MKNVWTCIIPIILLSPGSHNVHRTPIFQVPPVKNLFIITVDGVRWQEVFQGADQKLLNIPEFSSDGTTIDLLYGGASPEERRRKLLPFFWNVIEQQGILYGNRVMQNKVNTLNGYRISYPGYNEIFSGNIDPEIFSNRKISNPHVTVLEYLNSLPAYKNRVAIFGSWDLFPWIFNSNKSGLAVFCGSENDDTSLTVFNQNNSIAASISEKENGTQNDMLTFLIAKDQIARKHPRIVYIAFGETDEFAHQQRYDLYLEQVNKCDRMIAELWHWIQSTPGYRDRTALLITTDHGRGDRVRNWMSHGSLIRNSSQTWIAAIGPGIPDSGEVRSAGQLYQQQLAFSIAELMGESFHPTVRTSDIQTTPGNN